VHHCFQHGPSSAAAGGRPARHAFPGLRPSVGSCYRNFSLPYYGLPRRGPKGIGLGPRTKVARSGVSVRAVPIPSPLRSPHLPAAASVSCHSDNRCFGKLNQRRDEQRNVPMQPPAVATPESNMERPSTAVGTGGALQRLKWILQFVTDFSVSEVASSARTS
jgi:hypothetical protein